MVNFVGAVCVSVGESLLDGELEELLVEEVESKADAEESDETADLRETFPHSLRIHFILRKEFRDIDSMLKLILIQCWIKQALICGTGKSKVFC